MQFGSEASPLQDDGSVSKQQGFVHVMRNEKNRTMMLGPKLQNKPLRTI
ncbi:MAG: hypothetical protein WDN02_01530 [Methylovirgula sp.]